MKSVSAKIQALERRLAINYQEYKQEHPGTHKTPSDPLFQPVVLRPKGWNGTSNEAFHKLQNEWTRPGHVYRGMTEAEYNNTVGAGKGIQSNKSHSFEHEGTSFAGDATTSESYVNYGRDDPRKTGKPNYLVEVEHGPDIVQDKDGYHKAQNAIPQHRIRRVWKMDAHPEGHIQAQQIKS